VECRRLQQTLNSGSVPIAAIPREQNSVGATDKPKLQQKLKEFLVTILQYPFQEGMNMSAGDVNYNTLKAAQALKSLQ
jgi:hypothetical protein